MRAMKPKQISMRRAVILIALNCALALTTVARVTDGTNTPAGTLISNRAEVTYQDESGAGFATVSPTVTVTVLPLAALVVTPDETAPSASVAPNERITRLFQICNIGNTPDQYDVTRFETSAPAALVELYFDLDDSGTLTDADRPARVGESLSPQIAPGACVGVLAVVDTNDVAPQSNLTLRLTARSRVASTSGNGTAEESGAIINAVGNGARFTSPDNTGLPPLKLVEGRDRIVASPGQTLTYSISFRNRGGVTARNVRVTDELPTQLAYVPNTLQLAGRPLTDAADADEGTIAGQRIEVRAGDVAPDQVVQIIFQARVTEAATPGGAIINTARVFADNAPEVSTSEAVAVVDPFGTVYAGHSNGTVRISGARVTLATDDDGTTALSLPPGVGFPPNLPNENPYLTNGQGHYSFALTPAQLGSVTQPARYVLSVTAPNYRPRLIEVVIRPAAGGLFEATVRALDGQPIAVAGGFALTTNVVLIESIASVALNVPLFNSSALEITKSADKQQAEIGDIVSYRLEVRNATAVSMSNVTVRDELPESFHYATGTARIESGGGGARAIEPETSGRILVFNIGALGPGERLSILYRVRVGANARDGETVNTALAAGRFPSGETITTPTARASVMVGRGVFSMRQVVIGRVFVDADLDGLFDRGELPVAGARVYLNNGQSVITDSEGLYNIPSVGDGALVLSLDPVTVPAGHALADDRRRTGRSWTRLLRTPLGGGALLRQNFALKAIGDAEDDASLRTAAKAEALTKTEQTAAAAQSAKSFPATVKPAPPTAAFINATTENTSGSINRQPTPSSTPQLAAGTYKLAAANNVEPIAPGEIVIAAPAAEAVVMTPALTLETRVAENWTAQAEVNGERVGANNIGERRVDHKNHVSTFVFVGINLRPGPNHIKVAAVSPGGVAGRIIEQTVYGRGPAKRLVVTPERNEVQAGGRDSTRIFVRAFDQWDHPAADGQVAIETSAGRFLAPRKEQDANREAPQVADAPRAAVEEGTNDSAPEPAVVSEQSQANHKQQIVSLKDGVASVQLVAEGSPDAAELRASTGEAVAQARVRFTPELRPALLVGLAEVSIGRAAPEISVRGDDESFRSRLAFFYRGQIFGENLLTLAYDSARPINRTAGRDRLFQLDPLERAYPLFGDSSLRFEDAQTNSKLYARLDRRRSYAMFGDMNADMDNLNLSGYARQLTGIKLHLENADGDFITATGARPDTAFARDVVPGGSFSLVRLSHGEILPGSEVVVLEVRDRRNPEIILSRETLARSVDYNLNPAIGEIFFLRPISTFDYQLNLLQVVVTYEHRAGGMSSAVYTARAAKRFAGAGLRLGLSFVDQQQDNFGSFMLGGIDAEQTLPRGGRLQFEWAMSRGRVAFGGNLLSAGIGGNDEHNGQAFRADLEQPLPFYEGVLRANFSRAAAGFLNPFGATVAPGAQRAAVSLDLKPRASRTLSFGLTDERNKTENVDNNRFTASFGWTEQWRENLRTFFGFDHRRLSDQTSDRETASNLFTAGAEYRPTAKLEFSIKREQNLGEADPTYPNQTTLAANYQWNQWTKLFFTQRLASAPIVPIADVSGTGFAATASRRETAIGVETKFGRFTSMSGRYQLENGINGTDSFAVIGLQNRLPISKTLSLDLGYERGFHIAGAGESFNNIALGASWQPTQNLRSSARYELRDRGGFGQLFTLGAAGRVSDGITTLGRFQWSRSIFGERGNMSFNGTAAIAVRPLESDRVAFLLSYNRRSLVQEGTNNLAATRDRADTLSSDGYWQATRNLELYGRFALKLSANGDANQPFAAATTYLGQARAQYRLGRYFDLAGEARSLWQLVSATRRTSYGAELGFWALPDLRVGGGYNFTTAVEPDGHAAFGARRGFYFTISSKLSNLFDLFGTSRQGLATHQNQPSNTVASENNR